MEARTPHYDLVTFQPEHLDGALALSRQAAWPHRLEDWQMALDLSSGVVAVDGGGRIVGTVLTTCYADDCATINMVIVDESTRGQGLGRRLMDAAFALAAARPLRLIATRDGLPLYEKLGFLRTGGMVMQHQGIPEVLPPVPPGVAFEDDVDLAVLTALDTAAFGGDRSGLMARLKAVGRFAVLRRDGAVVGFTALRAFGRGEVIGPVVAATAEDAKALIAVCLAARPGAFLRIDTTEDTGLSPWLSGLGLAHVGGGVVMRRGDPLAPIGTATARTFALANQALG
ncbi:GNAT family N-acetyltransferase [Novispirillum itersonii]|uniref:Putative N-acetyltransferase YhbS n=1 Tax=Novispirillum itersonii TaxID=189 RepID=A0A7X0DMR2_NOVIT|nr:GNAT family N-acetyltransferase [Novispirillum itersonii]MBB6211321.1 putative N-acetyltransferase YhbS [Novispirillum itersonii]